MSILWMGGEDVDFPTNTPTVNTATTAYRRTSYARCVLNQTSTSNNPSKSLPFVGGAVTSVWISCQANASGLSANQRMIGLGRSGQSGGIFLGTGSATANKLTIWKYDGSTWTALAAESGTSLAVAIHKYDLQITSYGATSTINAYIDSALLATFTGDSTISGSVSDLDSVLIYTGSIANGWFVSEIIVADEDTRTLSLATLPPSGAGDANAWTGSYTDVSETTIDDATVVYTNATAQDVQLALGDLPAGTFSVRAVEIAARAGASTGATVGSIDLGVKSGGTVDPGTPQAVATGWATYERIMATNPVTSSAWTTSGVNALQLNLRSA